MNIDKNKLKLGIWYTDDDLNIIPNPKELVCPDGATHAFVCFPLEINTRMYRITEREDGLRGWGDKDKCCTFQTHLGSASGRLAVAMVNSGDYELDEALSVLANCCERCVNVLFRKYAPEVDCGYEEFSDEWQKANTECDFCKGIVHQERGNDETLSVSCDKTRKHPGDNA